MRTTLFTGLALIAGGVVAVLVGAALDLELQPTAWLGIAAGAVLALVPDRAPALRALSFVGGIAVAWVAYAVRAALLPDSTSGRTVAIAVLMGLCVLLSLVTLTRLPLWAILLGAGTFAGGYEAPYAAAPPELLDTSVTAITSVLLMAALGFLAASLAAPQPAQGRRRAATSDSDLPVLEAAR